MSKSAVQHCAAVVLALLGAVSAKQVTPKPCPSSTPATTPSGGTNGQGHSNTDAGRATAKATEKLEDNLAVHAKVACSICTSNLKQCTRRIGYPPDAAPTIVDYDCGGQWTYCKQATYSGSYTVKCDECP
jgi:hypothetical protein